MFPLISDARFESLVTLVGTIVMIVPATLAALWARSAKKNSVEAKENSAGALHEVKANGGMSDPDPTLKDYIKYVGENMEKDSRRLDNVEALIEEHLRHSKLMDSILAEVFFAVKPDLAPEEFPS